MKKNLLYVLAAALILSMTACTKPAENTDAEGEDTVGTETEVETETETEVEEETETETEVEEETETETEVEEETEPETEVETETEPEPEQKPVESKPATPTTPVVIPETEPEVEPEVPVETPDNAPAASPEETPATPEVMPEVTPEEAPVETPDAPAEGGATVGNELAAIFSGNNDGTCEEIANNLITEGELPFAAGAMTVEEGLLTGFDNAEITGFTDAAVFMPMIGSIPFVGYVFELEEGTDVEAFKQNLADNANQRWNICVSADETVIESDGNKVFFVMSPSQFEEAPADETGDNDFSF